MTQIKGKVAWITGASSGIGAALAEVLAKEGAKIILSGRRTEALEEVANSVETDTLVLPFETTDYEKLPEIVETAWKWNGQVNILVNNAGISQRSLAINTMPQVYQNLINIDLLAPIWLTQLQLSKMADNGGAHIVAISSIAGRVGVALRTAYCAAKHGLIGYMDALRSEVQLLHNIKVTNVLPGSVATNVSRNAITSDGSRRGKSDPVIDNGDSPVDCAKSIVEAIENDVPELIFAKGMEMEISRLRQSDPDKLFEMTATFGKATAENHIAQGDR